MTLRRGLVAVHRWLGIAAAALWLLQAATGALIVFHWEIDDAITPGAHRATDFRLIEQRIRPLAPQSMWSTAGAPDRFDVFVDGGVVRIDGAGNTLRRRRDDEKFAHGGIVDTIVVLHQSLTIGDRGRWITGGSGLLLLSNLLLGIVAAWPRRGQWLRALRPSRSGGAVARRYSRHRAVGLWLAIPAMCVVTAGVLLAFDAQLETLLRAEPDAPAARPSAGPLPVGLAAACETALGQYRGAVVSGVKFPTPENAMWTITLKQPHELQRAYGKTRVFVSAVDGSVIAKDDALAAKSSRRFLDLLFPFHTGEMAGVAGRLIVLATGVCLLVVIYFGVSLWFARLTSSKSGSTSR